MSTKSITINIFNKETSQEWKASYEEFDKQGNEILSEDYDYDGSVNNKIVTKYDEKNRKKEISIYSTDDFLSERHVLEYIGNTDKILAEEIVYADMSKSIKSYTYEDNKVKIITQDEDEEIEEQEFLELDNDGHIIFKKIIDDFENVTTNQRAFYENGKLVKRIEYDENDEETQHSEFKYNADNLLIQVKTIGKNGKIFDYNQFEYDDKGREKIRQIGTRGRVETEYNDELRQVISTTKASTGQIFGTSVTTYDEQGRILEEQDTTETKKYVYVEW